MQQPVGRFNSGTLSASFKRCGSLRVNPGRTCGRTKLLFIIVLEDLRTYDGVRASRGYKCATASYICKRVETEDKEFEIFVSIAATMGNIGKDPAPPSLSMARSMCVCVPLPPSVLHTLRVGAIGHKR